ncbi:ribonuclease III [Erysipelotrichaceae bacterium OttesenSCG-928-M19]|nr:ribonuclease III [Erysipelotrichaceae bacterium OttesenSCG-928-M19]
MGYSAYLKDKLNINIKNEELINQALVHPSYANEINKVEYNYERLEFMGDAILQFLVSDYIYNKYPNIDEGELTVLRAKAVREDSLAQFAVAYSLSEYIKVGKGEQKSGGTKKKSVQANVFEAVLGAIYLSNGIEDASKFLEVLYQSIAEDRFEDLEDYKTKLQEYVQADSKRTVSYELLEATGTANQPLFKFKVLMDDLVLGYGSGSSKKKAQQNAAKDALEKMVKG